MEQRNEIILCQYGNHYIEKNEITENGLKCYYTICKKCTQERKKKNRKKYKQEYNEKHKEYMRQWRMNKKEELLLQQNNKI
jgi:hypothetical protein